MQLHIPSSVNDECEHQGMHRHQCPACNTVWKHSDAEMAQCGPSEGYEAHTCPRCGEEQFWKYPYVPDHAAEAFDRAMEAALHKLFFGN